MSLRVGEAVRFSEIGRRKVSGMPEAWGLHTALRLGEVGRVLECEEGPEGPQLSVEFPSGSAYGWDSECFEPV